MPELAPAPSGAFALEEVFADGDAALHRRKIGGYAFVDHLVSHHRREVT